MGGVAAFAIAYQMVSIPKQNDLVTAKTTIIYSNNGKNELGRFASRNRVPVTFDQMPRHLTDAVVAAENRSFWSDPGFDAVGIAQAAFGNLTGTSRGGASTITQQYVKNFYLSPDRTLERKFRELFISIKVDQRMSKEKILESYLNTAYFGRGSWGVQTAAHAYFGKDVGDLSVEESAVLVSLLKAPNNYDPAKNNGDTSQLEGRFNYVMSGMAEMGKISESRAESAELPKIQNAHQNADFSGPNGYILSEVRRELKGMGFSDKEIEAGGLRVTTTIDPKAQRAMEKAFEKKFPEKDAKGVHAGGAAVRPGTGEIVAMYGGENYQERQWNDATQTKIQPGSTFKPFALAAALNEGISLQSEFYGNTPYWINDNKEDKDNRVQNEFDEDYGESVDLLHATRDSINTAYVDMTMTELGPKKVKKAAIRAGVPKDTKGLHANGKVALGFASVSPVDMANAYATFAAEGYSAERHLIAKVITKNGEVEAEHDVKVKKAFDRDVMRDLTYALQDVIKNGSGESNASKVNRPAAGKTGTHESKTAWFVGYTPQISASVAFYKDENGDGTKESLDGTAGMDTFFGGGYPAKIWASFMRDALKGEPKREFPEPAHIGEEQDDSGSDQASDPITDVPTQTDTPTSDPTTSSPEPDPTDTTTEPDPDPTETDTPPDPDPTDTYTPPDPDPTDTTTEPDPDPTDDDGDGPPDPGNPDPWPVD